MPAGRASTVLAGLAALLAGWVYKAVLRPPPPRTCGSPGGPPVTSPRVRLADGRYLAYREWGVPREAARYRVVLVHGFGDSKDFGPKASPELVEELGVYFVSFDRAGYGESDPNPNRTVASEAMDVQELADQLDLGDRFYVIGASMGGYTAWSCIRYIPHRHFKSPLMVLLVLL
ncbi:hypothetical protein Taro_055752 [Colocasia esculenta]|uniref:AB hydrolase-1 domain-containing protein n=1 Tax=Colocasia esculenta TaxID=4460 RepID=A0A843XS44_COLES|nr:hypothetical protein [Colocasia esculenta]